MPRKYAVKKKTKKSSPSKPWFSAVVTGFLLLGSIWLVVLQWSPASSKGTFGTMIMFICLMVDNIWFRLAAAVLFGLAALTDWLDGKIARQTGTMTPFGAIADPFVDKILVGAVYIGFASLPMLNVPLWAVFLIIARELMCVISVACIIMPFAIGGSLVSFVRARAAAQRAASQPAHAAAFPAERGGIHILLRAVFKP